MTQAQQRHHLQRVPPHDLATEASLLGAALLRTSAAAIVADLPPEAFYKPTHGHIAAAIGRLHHAGQPTDTGTVAAILRQEGLFDTVGGHGYLAELMASAPNTTSAPTWADFVTELWQRRRILGLAAELAEGVYQNAELSGLIAELAAATQAHEFAARSTWEPVNLLAVLAGEVAETAPALLTRSDGAALLYPGKVHSFAAESESGKSWLALLACVQVIDAGGHVAYVDFEDSPGSIVERLLDLGAHPDTLLERFHYVRPDDPIDASARLRILELCRTWPIALAVCDGVTEAMVISGWSIIDNDDVARFFAGLPRVFAREGAAVVLIDHVVKDKEQRGRYAIGGQHKLAGIDGAAYTLDIVQPFGRGRNGKARVTVTKDRPGFVRAVSVGGRHVGEFTLSPGQHTGVVARLAAPVETGGPFRPTVLMERISRALEQAGQPLSLNQLRSVVQGKNDAKDLALQVLVQEGFVARDPGPNRSFLHRLIRPFTDDSEPDGGPEDVRPEQF